MLSSHPIGTLFILMGVLLTSCIAGPETWKSPRKLAGLALQVYFAIAVAVCAMGLLLLSLVYGLQRLGVTGDPALQVICGAMFAVVLLLKWHADRRRAATDTARKGG